MERSFAEIKKEIDHVELAKFMYEVSHMFLDKASKKCDDARKAYDNQEFDLFDEYLKEAKKYKESARFVIELAEKEEQMAS